MIIRPATADDYEILGQVMHMAIHSMPSPYSDTQKHAWCPAPHSDAPWHNKLRAQIVVVAERDGNQHGFMTLRDDGYVDLAFVLPSARGTGTFRALYCALERHARAAGLATLTTHASLMAHKPFEAVGFRVRHRETVTSNGIDLDRYDMVKTLRL